ncbi:MULTISPECIES: CU044_2847 family protein [unclassified Streptomyces]|uniref:CU044_2847 family protein n=1 Tax=Streptomyces sp. NPDC127129 TaxID=3345373 RepID=UPI00362DFBF1
MPEYLDLELGGAALRVELADAGEPAAPFVPAPSPEAADLPDGFGTATPVARGRGAAALAQDVLQTALRPLGPLLEEVHAAVTGTEHPPQELTVEFGIQIGQDFKLGIVGANGQATMTVSATWQDQGTGSPRA